jgi:thioredoxin
MKNLTVTEFKELVYDYENEKEWNYKGTKPSIIDFYAQWCQPCKMLTPVLEELSVEYDDIDFYKVNVDDETELSVLFNVRSIPTLAFIPLDGDPQISMGVLPKDKLKEAFKSVFNIEK